MAPCFIINFVNNFQLIGDSTGQQWTPGILVRLLKEISDTGNSRKLLHNTVDTNSADYAPVTHWIVLDGPVSVGVMEWVHSLVTLPYSINLPDKECLRLPGNREMCRVKKFVIAYSCSFFRQLPHID